MKRYPLATIGRGGWRVFDPSGSWPCTISGYDRELPLEYRKHAEIIVDTTVCSFERLSVLSLCGPIIDVSVPDGMVSKLWQGVAPWDPTPLSSRDPECGPLGNAGSFDSVGAELYARLALAFGARVTRLADEGGAS